MTEVINRYVGASFEYPYGLEEHFANKHERVIADSYLTDDPYGDLRATIKEKSFLPRDKDDKQFLNIMAKISLALERGNRVVITDTMIGSFVYMIEQVDTSDMLAITKLAYLFDLRANTATMWQ